MRVACPAEGVGLVQLRNGMPEAAERGRKVTNARSALQHGTSLESAYGAARAERSHRITQSVEYQKTSELTVSNLGGNTTVPTRPRHFMPPRLSSNTSTDGGSTTSLGSPFRYMINLSVKRLFLISNLNGAVWLKASPSSGGAAPCRIAAQALPPRTPGDWKRKGREKGKGMGEEGGGGGAAPLRPPLGAVWREVSPGFGGKSGFWRARESRAAGAQRGRGSRSAAMPAEGDLLSSAAACLEADEQQYLQQVRYILQHGRRREDRTGTGTISVFGMQARYSLRGEHRRDPRPLPLLSPPAPAP